MSVHVQDGGRRKTKLVLADQLWVSGVNFAVGLMLARFLGQEGYGQYVLAYGVILFVAGIQMAVIITPMMVIGPSLAAEKSGGYYHAVIFQQLLYCVSIGAVLVAGGFVLAKLYPAWGLHTLLWPLLAAALFFLTQDFIRRYFFVRNRPGAALLNDVVGYSLRFILILIFGVTFGFSASEALWFIAAASLVALIVAIVQYHRMETWAVPGHGPWSHAVHEHWDFGKWLIATSVVYWAGSQLIIYMTAGVISVKAVGAMSASLNIVGAANILFLAMENLVPSRAARMYADYGNDGLSRYLRRVFLLGGLGTLGIAIVAGLWSEFWLEFFYGGAYKGYGWIVLWWGLYYIIGFFQRPLSAGLRVLGNTRGIFMASAAGALIAISVSYPAMRFAGINGSMAALCLVQITVVSSLALSYRKALKKSAQKGLN